MITRGEALGLDAVPPGILLPSIAALTVVCRHGALGADLEVLVVIVSYLFVGLGLELSLCVNAVVLAMLLEPKAFPAEEMVYQLMIMCGSLAQGSFALQALGQIVSLGCVCGVQPFALAARLDYAFDLLSSTCRAAGEGVQCIYVCGIIESGISPKPKTTANETRRIIRRCPW